MPLHEVILTYVILYIFIFSINLILLSLSLKKFYDVYELNKNWLLNFILSPLN